MSRHGGVYEALASGVLHQGGFAGPPDSASARRCLALSTPSRGTLANPGLAHREGPRATKPAARVYSGSPKSSGSTAIPSPTVAPAVPTARSNGTSPHQCEAHTSRRRVTEDLVFQSLVATITPRAIAAQAAPATISNRNHGDGMTTPTISTNPARATPTTHSRRARDGWLT